MSNEKNAVISADGIGSFLAGRAFAVGAWPYCTDFLAGFIEAAGGLL